MKRWLYILVLFLMVMSLFLESADIKFSGLAQPWFYIAEQHSSQDMTFGFTLRRIRFKPHGAFSKSIRWTLQFAWDKQVARILDAYIDFQILNNIHFQVGQFTVPGSVSSSLTSSGKLDLIERPLITQQWSQNSGLSSYRAVGAQIHGNLFKNAVYYAFMVANPKTYGILTPTLVSNEYINENNGLSIWGRLEFNLIQGLRFGGFFGTGEEKNSEIKRNSYGAHLFYVKNHINLKLEYIRGGITEKGNEKKYHGVYAVLGYQVKQFEPIIRYGMYIPVTGQADDSGVEKYKDLTLGMNYFHNKNIKIQANYVIRDETMAETMDETIKNNIFYINFQYSF